MPPLEQAERTDTLTLFPFLSRNHYGVITPGAGIEFQGRWLEIQAETPAKDSSEVAFDVSVVLAYNVAVGSLLWNGRLSDYEDGTGTAQNELVEVKRVDTFRDIKGYGRAGQVRYVARCNRYTQRKNP